MSKDRDGSVRARRVVSEGDTYWQGRYKYNGRWYTVKGMAGLMVYCHAADAREAAYAMYNVAINGGQHQ